jgi:hypothetical protein
MIALPTACRMHIMKSMEEEASVRNITAAAGLLAGASVLLTVPLYFMYGGAPPYMK